MPEQQMRVVLGADPLFQRATGIGNYTRNLASNILALQLVDELMLYAHGAALPGERLASLVDSLNESTLGQRSHPTSASTGGLLSICGVILRRSSGHSGRIKASCLSLTAPGCISTEMQCFILPTICCQLLPGPRWSRFMISRYSGIRSTTLLSACGS